MNSNSSNRPAASAKHPAPAAPATAVDQGVVETAAAEAAPAAPREFGGRKDGTEPTRFGDWEKNGRCVDF